MAARLKIALVLFTGLASIAIGAGTPPAETKNKEQKLSPKEMEKVASETRSETKSLGTDIQNMIKDKKYKEATEKLQAKGRSWIGKFGEKSWPMAEVSNLLADVFLACGKACEKEKNAAELRVKVLQVWEKEYGAESDQVMGGMRKAAQAFDQIGEHKKAAGYWYQFAKKASARVTGKEDSGNLVRSTWQHVAQSSEKASEWRIAEESYQKVLERRAGMDEKELAITMLHYSLAIAKGGGPDSSDSLKRAYESAQEALDLASTAFGKSHLQYAKSLNGIAGIEERLGKLEDAVMHMSQALEIVEKEFGAEDEFVKAARTNLDVLRSRVEKSDF